MASNTPLKSNCMSGRGAERRMMDERASSPFLKRALTSPPIRKGTPQCDRFIPNRSAMNLDVARLNLMMETKENSSGGSLTGAMVASPCGKGEDYKKHLSENLLNENVVGEHTKILTFKSKAPPAAAVDMGFENAVLYSQNGFSTTKSRRSFRHIPQAPERILDAPDLLDDYYLNLLDWSGDNVVAVALGAVVYLWDAGTGTIEQLTQPLAADDYVTSVSWASDGRHIAVGLNSTNVQLWDATRLKMIRTMGGHSARVGSLAWNGHLLSSGGRDNSIINHDVRIREHLVSRFCAHEQEVCGLRWSPSGQQLASGGNDNMLYVWDASAVSSAQSNASRYLHRLDQHLAAVKALAWCPFQGNLLASGGGTADRCIKFWNTHTGVCLNSIDTHSQVCALQWSRHEKEILSSHGYSQNQLCLWKYPTMAKMAELTGHTARVLHLAQSPDGYSVVSGAADETLRFWKVFGAPESGKRASKPKGEASGVRCINNIR